MKFSRYTSALILTAALSTIGCQNQQTTSAVTDQTEQTTAVQAPVEGAIVPVDAMKSASEMDSLVLIRKVEETLRTGVLNNKQKQALNSELLAVLTADSPWEVKIFAGSVLARYGSEKEVGQLAKLVLDPETAHAARTALELIPGDKADQALIDALNSDNETIVIGAINSLAFRKCQDAIKPISEKLIDDSPAIQSAAIDALASIGDTSAISTLKDAKDDVKPANMFKWEEAMLALALTKDKAPVDLYQNLLDNSASFVIRRAAFHQLVKSSDDHAIDLVIAAINDDQHELHLPAIRTVRNNDDPERTEEFAALLDTVSKETQSQLLAALEARGDSAAQPAVLQLLDSEDEDTRIAALKTLGGIGNTDIILTLAKQSDEKGAEAETAFNSLVRIQDPDANDRIMSLLGGDELDNGFRVQLINACAERKIYDSFDLLAANAKHGDRKVSSASLAALGELANQEQLPILVAFVSDADNTSTRKKASEALGKAANRLNQEKSSDVIIEAMNGADEKAKEEFLSILGKVGSDKALPILVDTAKDSNNVKLQKSAIKALGQWPTEAPAKDLGNLTENSTDKTLRTLAFRGYMDVTAKSADENFRWEQYNLAAELASTAADKKLLISGIASMNSLEALNRVLEYLDNEEVAEEAALAIANLSSQLRNDFPEEMKAAIQKAAAVSDNPAVQDELGRFMSALSEDNYILTWDFAGPFRIEGSEDTDALFDKEFSPETDGSGNWRMIRGGNDQTRPWMVDLNEVCGGQEDFCVGYLRTWFRCPEERKAMLEIGSDDGVKIWLNGELVHANNTSRGVKPGEDEALVTFQRGTNEMLIKIIQGHSEWGSSLRVSQIEGHSLAGYMVKGTGQFMIDLPVTEYQGHVDVEPAQAAPPVWATERFEGDPFNGDYQGTVTEDGKETPLCAQVIAVGQDKFVVQLIPEFDKKQDSLAVLEGTVANGQIAVKGNGWSGVITTDGFELSNDTTNQSATLEKVVRLSPTLGRKAPDDAIILFDGSNFDEWTAGAGGDVTWTLVDGDAMQVTPKTDSIMTKRAFKDFEMHLEFRSPYAPGNEHQFYGNSGVFLQMTYEVQIHQNYGSEGLINECGAIYNVKTPDINMCAPPLQWQTYDINYRSPRIGEDGKVTEYPRLTLRHNGVVIHDDYELTKTSFDSDPPAEARQILLQDHHNQVQFKNIWIRELN